MSNSLLDTVYRNGPDLLSEVEILLDKGEDPNVITEYAETPLRVASNRGRFDTIKLLLSRGADESQLAWTNIFHAIAFDSAEHLEDLISGEVDLEARDFWGRTLLLFSILVGEIEKTKLLIEAGADVNAVGRCGKTPMAYAIQKDDIEMIKFLIGQGFNTEQRDDFDYTPLIEAAEKGATKCVKLLIDAGVDVFAENHIPEQAIAVASNLDIVNALVKAGADINDISKEMRAEMLGYSVDEAPDISKEEYFKGKNRIFGKHNPELSNNTFWHAMVKSGGSGYLASSKFEEDKDIFNSEPVWSFDRFGKSITPLNDGRFVEIAGEHEDYYDPDFCIYNDVFVHNGHGECEIYIYPRDVFPPTDFHTATLIDNFIYIIGNLGYIDDRQPGFTPVYRLNIETLKIDKVETTGEMPGWISHHKAYFDGESTIRIKGGNLIVSQDGKVDYVANENDYLFNITSMIWEKLQS